MASSTNKVGFGAMGMTAFYGSPMSSEDAFALMQAVYDDPNSSRFIDTAEIYKSGNPMGFAEGDIYNETVLSAFLATVPRDTFTICTKFMPFKWENKCDYETVKAAVNASLSRLGLDYIDVYYIHRIPSLEGLLEFAASCKKLVEEGLIRSVGVSECTGAWLREAHQVCPIGYVQQEWSLLTRSLETELVPVCVELGVTVVAYSPLCRNLLATKEKPQENDWRANLPRYTGEAYANNLSLAEEVTAVATAKGVSPAQLSLAWLFYQAAKMGVTVIPIPGTTKIANAASNFAAGAVFLTDDEAGLLEGLAGRVQGLRYPENMMGGTIDAKSL